MSSLGAMVSARFQTVRACGRQLEYVEIRQRCAADPEGLTGHNIQKSSYRFIVTLIDSSNKVTLSRLPLTIPPHMNVKC